MVRKLARCSVARRLQLDLLERHRSQKYNDRVVYWHSRNIARSFASSPCPGTVVLICDSMDQAKFSWPKDSCLQAKEYNQFIAPRLTATAVIAHGQDVFLALSLPGLSSDSSRTIEVLARTFERFRERGQDLRQTEVVIQGDNGPKEIKNNGVIRYMSMLVSQGKIRRAEVRQLMSGHTHPRLSFVHPLRVHGANSYLYLILPSRQMAEKMRENCCFVDSWRIHLILHDAHDLDCQLATPKHALTGSMQLGQRDWLLLFGSNRVDHGYKYEYSIFVLFYKYIMWLYSWNLPIQICVLRRVVVECQRSW